MQLSEYFLQEENSTNSLYSRVGGGATAKKPRKPRTERPRGPLFASFLRYVRARPDAPLHGTYDDPSTRDGREFRLRFRVPYPVFEEIVAHVRESGIHPERRNCAGTPSCRVDVLVLGALRILGRSWTFDDVEEATGYSSESNRLFFISFVALMGRGDYFKRWVKPPSTPEEMAVAMKPYSMAGFPGAVGSVDGVHIWWDAAPAGLQNYCRGKDKFPTLGWQVVVNHEREIMSVSDCSYGGVNDLTASQYDKYLQMVRRREGLFGSTKYSLFDHAGNTITKEGVWLLCDNGYHEWTCLQAPMKFTSRPSASRWSRWLESMRKDVECTFGILKRRFRILHGGLRFHKVATIHNLFLTCCALHNRLLKYDALENVIGARQRGGRLHGGIEDTNAVNRIEERVAHALNRGPGNDGSFVGGKKGDLETEREDGHTAFREQLITHHNYLFQRGQLRWPKLRDGTAQPSDAIAV